MTKLEYLNGGRLSRIHAIETITDAFCLDFSPDFAQSVYWINSIQSVFVNTFKTIQFLQLNQYFI